MKARLGVLGAALLFSTGGAFIKLCTLAGWQVACLRSAVAAIALWLFMPSARRNWSWRMLPVGLAYALTLVLFVQANKLTTATHAIFLQATSPLYLLILGPLLLHERTRRSDVLITGIVASGALLLFLGGGTPMATAPNPHLGNLIALAAGVTWALTIAGLRWMGRDPKHAEAAASTVIVGNLIAFAIALPGAIPFQTISTADVAVLFYLGTFQVGLAYWLLTRSIRRVKALEASTLLLAEPVFNPVLTWLVHGERPAALAFAGCAVILAATLAGAWWQSRRVLP